MRKPFNLPTITELAVAYHNDMLMYQKELDQLEANANQSVYDIFRCEELRRKVKDCEVTLEKYKTEIREDKLNQLGI
jgi:hypothetical protein